ncbi:uncharacterized protein LOC134231802 [Saccostrea cucullata]|uniref:uncharacterized protein LOC134231802 n=1 Tax=Saccostrea cuccullata TaxID=36930 RepID=UPI002ED113B3
MITDATAQIKVIQCSQCQNDVEFYCRPCKQNLCMTCKQRHVVYINTKDHDVVIYRLKHGDFIIPESCEKHRNCKYKNWCKSCECPICDKNYEHRRHKLIDIKLSYKVQRQKNRGKIIEIRGESLPYNCAMLADLYSDTKALKAKCSSIKNQPTVKAENLKKLIDIQNKTLNVLYKRNFNIGFILKHHKMKEYVDKYEQLANKPVKFLLFIKKTPIPKAIDLPDTIMCNVNEKIETGDILELLVDIKITEVGKRKVRNEQMLKLMPQGMLKKYVDVGGLIHKISHISFVTPDRIWINDGRSLFLTNSKGNILHRLVAVNNYLGVHCATSAGELIYVDKDWNINKLSTNNATKSTLIKRIEMRRPLCVCHSSSTGDLLVMMGYVSDNNSIQEAKMIRYNSTVQPIQTVQYNISGKPLYDTPKYITENHNGDIVVSDKFNGVVVTDHKGKYRFTYTGPPIISGSPYGTCVDVFLNILICCKKNKAIYMINKDGDFLSSITAEQLEGRMAEPFGLAYDNENHLVWMGSSNTSRLCVYRYIERKDYLADIS